MKPRQIPIAFLIKLLVGVALSGYFVGCFPDRTPTDPDFKAQDVRRPAVAYHSPTSNAVEISRTSPIIIWFDELMDENSVQQNFRVWPYVKMDSTFVFARDANNPDILYAGKSGTGLFKSEDGAESWQWITRGYLRVQITDIVVCRGNSNILYIATADSGVLKSVDGGVTWQAVNEGLPENNITSLAVSPINDDVLYITTNSNGIYKSEDGGASWSAKNAGVRTTRRPLHVEINPLNTNTLYVATKGDFILRSTNQGESWTRMRKGFFTFNFNSVRIHPADTTLVFAISDGGGIYRSEDSGQNWQLISDGITDLNIQDVVFNPQDVNTILLSTTTGFYLSRNKGDDWQQISVLAEGLFAVRMANDPENPSRVFAGTSSGIYRSDDLGQHWVAKSSLSLDALYVEGTFDFQIWQDSTLVMAPINATKTDTSIIFPYIYSRALEAWIANGKKGEPPVEANPKATKMIFQPKEPLLALRKYQVRIVGTFENDRETLRNSFGARDIHGNSFEIDYNFTFTTGEHE